MFNFDTLESFPTTRRLQFVTYGDTLVVDMERFSAGKLMTTLIQRHVRILRGSKNFSNKRGTTFLQEGLMLLDEPAAVAGGLVGAATIVSYACLFYIIVIIIVSRLCTQYSINIVYKLIWNFNGIM